jgi:hypothetical protein
MNTDPSIVYFHTGAIPAYLRATLESARYFNPDARIFLLTDVAPSGLPQLRIEIRKLAELRSPKCDNFYRRYVHVSATKFDYERTCIGRWFYIAHLMQHEGCARAVYLDSDAMLFHDIRQLFAFMPAGPRLLCSHASGPAVTFIQDSLEPFLDSILAKYDDTQFLDDARIRCAKAGETGDMGNLTDMNFIQMFIHNGSGLGSSYPNDLPIGHIDHSIFGPSDGMMSRPNRRHLASKHVFWQDDGRTFRPYFRRATDGSLVPALAIHFQNGAKRRICRFNRVGADSPLPRSLRLRYYTWLLN